MDPTKLYRLQPPPQTRLGLEDQARQIQAGERAGDRARGRARRTWGLANGRACPRARVCDWRRALRSTVSRRVRACERCAPRGVRRAEIRAQIVDVLRAHARAQHARTRLHAGQWEMEGEIDVGKAKYQTRLGFVLVRSVCNNEANQCCAMGIRWLKRDLPIRQLEGNFTHDNSSSTTSNGLLARCFFFS